MSRFFSSKYSAQEPYVPGEQPSGMSEYVKLNTNESPFPPSAAAKEYALRSTRALNLYSDPDSVELTKAIAETYGVERNMVLATNGSDEILNFAFMAFGGNGAHGELWNRSYDECAAACPRFYQA